MSSLRGATGGGWSLRHSIQPTVRHTPVVPAMPALEPFAPGDLIAGAFRVAGLLGSGGMGHVYDAFDERLGRRVAIKVLRPEHVDRSVGILREELALAQIRHPGVCAVYLAGEHQGRSYFVMERIDGRTLAQVVKQAKGRLPLDEVLDILVSLADVLRVVHEHGIVHRDIKPRNIIVAPKGRVVLVDFGLFKPVGSNAPDIEGTPEYMAPETIGCGVVDGPVDVYALGVVAFELMTGKLPFEKSTTNATLAAHVVERPPLVGQVRGDVPDELSSLVARLLDKDPSCRPTAEDAAAALRTIRRSLSEAMGPSVLVVDDDATMRALVTALAKPSGAVVECASDAEKALALIQRTPPQLMFLDLHLPDQSGVELMMALRGMRLAQATKVVAISGRAHPSDVELLRLLGVEQYIPKGASFASDVARVFAEVRALGRSEAPVETRLDARRETRGDKRAGTSTVTGPDAPSKPRRRQR